MTDHEQGGDAPCWANLFEVEIATRVRVRRASAAPAPDDGRRVLVDRLWPHGPAKARARLDDWCREIAPSDELRRWYGHDPARWEEFARRYRAELAEPERAAAVDELVRQAGEGSLTLLCAARDVSRSNAEVLRQVLVERLRGASGDRAPAGC